MIEDITQGTRANNNGHFVEFLESQIFSHYKIRDIQYADFIKNPYSYGSELFIRNYHYRVGRINGRLDGLLVSNKFGLLYTVECKSQVTGGSADEKLHSVVYRFFNMDCPNVNKGLLVLCGDGFSENVLSEVSNDIKDRMSRSDKELEIKRLDSLITWPYTWNRNNSCDMFSQVAEQITVQRDLFYDE